MLSAKLEIVKSGMAIVLLLSTTTCADSITSAVSPRNVDPCKLPITALSKPAPDAKRKVALLVGINKYRGEGKDKPSTLEGAINDVCRMKAVLISPMYGFAPTDVHALVGEEATRDAIIEGFKTYLIGTMREGKDDIAVFAFSGHGSYVEDEADPTKIDQTIVAVDSRDPKVMRDIRDKELNELLKALTVKTKNITVILDSCHSGTALKDVNLAPVRLAPPISGTMIASSLHSPVTSGKNIGFSGSGFHDADVSYVLMAAAQSDQQAREYPGEDGKMYGALIYFLTKEMMRPSSVQRTYRDIMGVVARQVNQVYVAQTPQLESGTANRFDSIILGDTNLPTQAYVEVIPIDQNVVEVVGGQLQGLTEGSIYDVYSSMAHTFELPEMPIGKIELVKVDEFKSDGKIIQGQISNLSRAVEREHRYGNARARVYFDGLAKSRLLRSVRSTFDANKRSPIEVVSEKRTANFILYEKDGQVHMVAQDGSVLSPPLPIDSQVVESNLRRRLEQWAQWFNLRRVENVSSSLRVMVQILRKDGSTAKQPGEVIRFKPNDVYNVKITNSSSKKLLIYILDFTSAGRISQVYPPKGETLVLEAGKDMVIPGWTAGLPKDGRKYVRDVLKLFATTDPVNFWFLEQDAIKDALEKMSQSDPLGQMLLNASFGSKDTSVNVPKNWTTDEAVEETCVAEGCPK